MFLGIRDFCEITKDGQIAIVNTINLVLLQQLEQKFEIFTCSVALSAPVCRLFLLFDTKRNILLKWKTPYELLKLFNPKYALNLICFVLPLIVFVSLIIGMHPKFSGHEDIESSKFIWKITCPQNFNISNVPKSPISASLLKKVPPFALLLENLKKVETI